MALVAGQGISRVHNNRRFETYQSLKQAFSNNRRVDEVHICGSVTTDGAAKEISFCDNVLNYIGAEGQVYIRTEADDGNQDGKYVYIEYQDDTGAVRPILTADLAAPDNTVEVIVTGASDFYRLRRMISEVESDTSGGKSVVLGDADMDFAADMYGEIRDNNSEFALERFFTQPNSVCDSYLAYIYMKAASTGAAATDDTYFTDITFTPRPTNLGEVAATADITLHLDFEQVLDVHPLVLLEGGTEVIFKVGDVYECTIPC